MDNQVIYPHTSKKFFATLIYLYNTTLIDNWNTRDSKEKYKLIIVDKRCLISVFKGCILWVMIRSKSISGWKCWFVNHVSAYKNKSKNIKKLQCLFLQLHAVKSNHLFCHFKCLWHIFLKVISENDGPSNSDFGGKCSKVTLNSLIRHHLCSIFFAKQMPYNYLWAEPVFILRLP